MFVTFFDTCMVSLAALVVWRFNPFLVFIPWLTIACLDGLYISSALIKVPDGAWFTITLAGVLACIFILWRFGKEQQWAAEAADRFPTTRLVQKGKDGQLQLTSEFGGDSLSVIKGFGIYFDKAGETTPLIFSQFLTKLLAAPEVMVFFHLRPLETPSVLPENRYNLSRLAIPNCYRLIVRHGYMDEVITPDLSSLVYEQLRNFIITQVARKAPIPLPTGDRENTTFVASVDDKNGNGNEATAESETTSSEKNFKSPHSDESISADLARLEQAYERQVLYIIGKEQMKIKPDSPIWRKILLHMFLFLRDNTRTKIANLRVPTDRVIEVGFVKDV
jgi:KUP system potassium uptake protein